MRAGITPLVGPKIDPLEVVRLEREKRKGMPRLVNRHPFVNGLHQLAGPLPGTDRGRIETLREFFRGFDGTDVDDAGD